MKDSRYEEALERAKQGLPIEDVFPELKESDDERIRKELLKEIEFISPRDGETDGEGLILPSYHARIDRYKSYLEKQKEQNLIPKFKVGDRIYDKRDSYNRNVIREVGKDYYINAFAQKMDMAYTDANFEFLEHLDNDLTPNKPAEWSEEDNEKIKRLRSIVNDCAFRNDALDVNGDYCEGDYEELDNWLKSLRPQPKQEWNWDDEDFEKFRDVLAKKAYLDEITSIKVARKLLGFLKHYHPQPHWKPSEEQIEALTYATGEGGKYNKAALKSLYEDLKSL